MNWLRNKKTVAVHSGNFHPDDVFSVALLSIIHKGKINVIRTRDQSIYSKADYIADIGFEYNPAENKFDHHQEGGAGDRGNKITYSSFGLLWQTYGVQVCGSKKVADILDKKLVQVVDADDCGVDLCKLNIPEVYPFMLTDVIYAIRPTWKENHLNIDKIFLEAVELAKKVLVREIKVIQDKVEAESIVDEIYFNSKDKRIIIFDKQNFLPKDLLCKYPEPTFVVYRDRDGKRWRAIPIEKKERSFELRKNFPKSWWGKSGEELVKVSGVPGAIFCRNEGVFVGAESKEGAIKMAEIALDSLE